MIIKNNAILYFSGTGNSLQVAKDISDKLAGFDLIKLTSLRDEGKITVTANAIGIVFPVYYARLPLVVEEIVKKLECNKNICFCSSNIWRSTCNSFKKLERILQNNGALLNAGFLVHMPKNHIFEYSTKPVKIGDKIFK